MSRFQTVFQALAVTMLAASCRLAPPASPVPVEGSPDQLSKVSGEWSGRYWSKATGRHGTIRFTLPEQADTGFGEVDITFSPALRAAQDASAADRTSCDPGAELDPHPCTSIALEVVRVEQNRVRGTLVPYWDPDCNCRAHTVFEGRISGDSIAGSFNTTRESTDRRILTGQWRVSRED
jgi:hypothetical protein